MLKKWFVSLVACASLLGARAVAAEKIDFDQSIDVKGIVQSLQAQVAKETAAEKAGMANWTIMVYVNAKNNLEKFGLGDVNEMEKVGSTDKVKIAVELGRISGYDSSDGDWKGQRRYIIQKDNNTSHVSSPVLQEIAKADMGDWKHLVDFVAWAKKTAPAQHYMLVVWNHGSGWDKFHKASDIVINGISYDDESGNHMSTPDLGSALAAMGKTDIYASDACLMQMAEVGYQIKDYTDYIVGSEETEPGDGYTYDTLLGPLVAKPSMSSLELAKTAVKSYSEHYAGIGEAGTQSAIQSATLPKLLSLLDGWTKAVMAANETAVVKNAHSQAQSFYVSDNKDLLHFAQLVDGASQDAAVKSKGAELEKFLADTVIVANGATGDSMSNAKGLAVYLPSWSFNSAYNELAWAKAGTWPQFAQWVQGLKDSVAAR
ncbi:MAG: clostripain-related cysteine peptidase [Elusimicrobia bacterium]|nr:clostripain-related cysteine peptidase [Elusimicrobiota bacterium]